MGQVVSGHLSWRCRFSPRQVHVEFMVDKVALGQFFFSLSFSVLPSKHYSTYAQHSFIHSFITYTLLTGESNAK
jgi:SNF family Na+-dependent transporter